MQKAKRILKNIDVAFISLVNKGANGKEIIFKRNTPPTPLPATQGRHTEGSSIKKAFTIIKTDDEKRLVYGTVYEPDTVDSQGDTASAEVIEKAAHNFLFLLKNKNVDTQHDFVADDGAVVESFILRAADPMFPDTKIGSWVVAIKVANDETWALVKSGEIAGLSLAGLAATEVPQDETEKSDTSLLKELVMVFKKHLGIEKDFDAELKATELRTKVWALQDAIYKVMNDDNVATEAKQTAVLESIDQFRKSVASDPVQKSGGEEKPKSNQGESVMDAKEVATIVAAELGKATKTITDSVEKVAADVTALAGRIETVEKSSKGSTQIEEDSTKTVVKKRFLLPDIFE